MLFGSCWAPGPTHRQTEGGTRGQGCITQQTRSSWRAGALAAPLNAPAPAELSLDLQLSNSQLPSAALSPPAMAPLLALFLVVLVGLPLAPALDCHVCAYNGENCFNPMRCPAMVSYCMTTRTYYTPTRMKVSKSCVPSCFETVYDGYSKHASTTSCCQYDLCNGAGLPIPGTLTLALAPVLLATLWGLL
ncbi:ly-6/neurotoxin-like protein 1 [Tamandua tetradactyla]|uniref:ly-6/neurotoxin-like protein 1 n=1 Tax=Tamandua tetradactyla TaxID=48850 RepID=UPI0040545BC2